MCAHGRLLGAGLVLGGLLGACSGDEPEPLPAAAPIAGRPSIVLVTVDTLRRDHLGCYGYPRDTSPALDALAREAVVFDRAVAPMATTFPSHLSLLTGQPPHRHGWLANADAALRPYEAGRDCLSAALTLRNAGWRTAAFVSAPPVSRHTGIGAGFDTFDQPDAILRTADATTDRALAWLEANAGEPFLLWIHYWDPHEPNEPPAAVQEPLAVDGSVEQLLADRGAEVGALPAVFLAGETCERIFPGSSGAIAERGLEPADLADLIARYDADVRTVDDQLGRLLERVDALGLADRSIVVFTADHGQSLGENAWIGHGRLSPSTLFVPLVVRFPAGVVEQPARIDRPVSLTDVMPTILARVDVRDGDLWFAQADGLDLFSGNFRRPWVLAQRTSRALEATPPGERFALVTDRWMLAWLLDGEPELYDLAADPHARSDAAAREPDVVRELSARLLQLVDTRASGPGEPVGPVDEELLRKLEGLGYVGDG